MDTDMNAILTKIFSGRTVYILSLLITAALVALAVQAVVGLAAAHAVPAQYCHFWCNEYGQCFWVCD